jgi:hypothetical protein
MQPAASSSSFSREDEDGYESDGALSTVSFTPSALALWFQMRNGELELRVLELPACAPSLPPRFQEGESGLDRGADELDFVAGNTYLAEDDV